MNITTLKVFDTEYSADSIEWCPNKEYHSFFVCGTYQLLEDEKYVTATMQCRKGRLYLFQFDIATKNVTELQRVETAAILDMKWLFPHNHNETNRKPLLATANASGRVEIFELMDNELSLRGSLALNPELNDLIVLSLEWKLHPNGNNDCNAYEILASDSKGNINIIEYTTDGVMQKRHSWQAHGFEAWICAFDKWDTNLIYTGGDDCFLYCYDTRSYNRVFTNKSHTAGVTCLLSHPYRANVLLSGSYDEHLRAFDTRNLKNPLQELNLNGGIWRLKTDPWNRSLVLAACMYQNFSIVKYDDKLTLVGEYNEHQSICYGADWCLDGNRDDKELYMATCSFYDHKLCVSSVKDE